MKSPEPPDPYATAQTQNKFNVGSANASQNVNMVDQSNPFGNLNYNITGQNADGTNKYSANTTLSAPFQSILVGTSGAAGKLANSGAGALGGGGLDLSNSATEDYLNRLNAKRLDPQWQQNTEAQESKLATQGLTPGMPGYDNAMRVFNQGKNDAYDSSYAHNHASAVSDLTQQYNAPVSALGSILGISKGTAPQFASTPTTNVAGTNYAGLAQDNYKQQAANANSQNGQIAGLVGTGLGIAAAPFTGGLSLAGAGAMGGLFGAGGGGAGYGNFGQYSPYSPMNG